MAAKKKTSPRRGARKRDAVAQAIAGGKREAMEVIERRAKQRKARARVVASAEARRAAAPEMSPAGMRAIEALGPFTAKAVLIAEGDSWFDYPRNDVLSKLEDKHGFDVESVAHWGDRVEDMAFAGGQLDAFSRRLEKLLQKGSIPKAILLSGGGNDIAGDEFEMLLNHANSPIAGLNDDVVTGVIDQRIAVSYAFVISAITAICEKYLHRPLPIVVHGYGYPVPDGREVGGVSFLPGPWLKPGFDRKGFSDRMKNTATMKALIDRFYVMMERLVAQFAHVHLVDLRRTLLNDATYKTYWGNELHPTEKGFELVAAKFAAVVDSLPS